MFDAGDRVEVATDDKPKLGFDAYGVVVHVDVPQGVATVRLDSDKVQMYPLRQIRDARTG